ncbi:MAG: hypothetical protein AAF842_04785 [Planctomycetota bacterium]
MHRQAPTSTALAAAIAALVAMSPSAPSAAAPLGILTEQHYRDRFTEFGDDYNPQWTGEVARLKQKPKGVRDRGTRSVEPGRKPGVTIGGSNGFGGSSRGDYNSDSFTITALGPTSEVYASDLDTGRLLNPFVVANTPNPDILANIDTRRSDTELNHVDRVRVNTKAKAKLDGVKTDADNGTGWRSRDLHRFSEVLLQQPNGKDKVLANASAVAEPDIQGSGNSGRVSAYVTAHKSASGKASASATSQDITTYDIARTQLLSIGGVVSVKGGGGVRLDVVDLNANRTVYSWTSDTLPRDGEYYVELYSGIDAGPALDTDADLAVRVVADAGLSAKANNRNIKGQTAAAEYQFWVNTFTPREYVAPQWEYVRTEVMIDGVATQTHAFTDIPSEDQTLRQGGTLVRTGGDERRAPGTVYDALPYDPDSLGTADYVGAYSLDATIRSALNDTLAAARITPTQDGRYFLSFEENIVVGMPNPLNKRVYENGSYNYYDAEDVAALTFDLYDALLALGYDAAGLEAALLLDADNQSLTYIDTRLDLLDPNSVQPDALDVNLVEVSGPLDWLWQPLDVSGFIQGNWLLTREEVMPTAEEALDSYVDRWNLTDLGGARSTRLATSLTISELNDAGVGAGSSSAPMAIGQQLPEDLTINGSAALLASADPVVNPTPTAAAGGLAGLVVLLRRRRVGRG